MAGDPLGTTVFLMTDIEGSTRLWETIPDRMPDLIARHDAAVAAAVAGNGGSLVKNRGEGDSHFAVFARGGDAVAGAVAIQRRLAEDEHLAAVPIRVRIGIHAGDATFRDMDYYGPSVNRCARIRGVGFGGQILVSEVAMSLAREMTAEGVAFRSLGHHRLRDLLRPECLFQVVADGLRVDFPTLASLNNANIPLQPTSFVGRRREVGEIVSRLRGTRLLTLLGTGGVGKTRLAYQAAAEAAEGHKDGVVVVELAEITDPGAVPGAFAAAMGLSDDPFPGLKDRHLLVVLDNCEHMLDAVRPLVRRVLRECPTVVILATSRETLRLPGEKAYDVHPLSLPPAEPESVEALLAAEAGRLFVERAEAVAPRFAPGPGNLRAIASVCARLDGLPLAIELAAARANVLSPAQIDERLAKRLQFLSAGRGSEEGRHRTMRETVDWSYRMLTPAERGLMGRLTAFRGGWTLDAVETALAGRWPFDDDPLDVMQSLVERSLAFVEELADDAVRYRLLETIRDFTLEATSPEDVETAHEGLFAWADAFAAEARDHFEGEDQGLWFERADADRENLRLAAVHGLGRPELRERALGLVVALSRWLVARGHYRLGRALVEPALAANPDAPAALRAKATNLAGVMAMCQGDLDAATTRLETGRELARAIGDLAAEGATLCNLGMIAWERDDCEGACRWYEEAVAALTAAGDQGRLGSALLNLGNVLINMGRLDAARDALQAALPPLRVRGDVSRLASVTGNLGHLAIVREDWAEARRAVRESLYAFREVGEWQSGANLLGDAATILLHFGRLEETAVIRGVLEAAARTAGAAASPRHTPRLAELDRTLGAALDEAQRERLRLQGLKMSIQSGVEYAVQALGPEP